MTKIFAQMRDGKLLPLNAKLACPALTDTVSLVPLRKISKGRISVAKGNRSLSLPVLIQPYPRLYAR